jgi:ankyrin repeat protein
MKHLISKKINTLDCFKNTFMDKEKEEELINACMDGNTKKVKELLRNGVDINTVDINGIHIFFLASWNKHVNIIQHLIKAGVDPNIRCSFGNTALMYAARDNHYKVVKILLRNGVPNGRTSGAWQSTTEQVRADPNIKNNGWGRDTALYNALYEGNFKIVKELIKHGAEYKYIEFATILHKCIICIPMLDKRFRRINSDIVRESWSYI